MINFIEFESIEHLERHIKEGKCLRNVVFQGLDLRGHTEVLRSSALENSIFLGCTLTPESTDDALEKGALVFPKLNSKPFNSYRNSLYSPEELIEGYEPHNPDTIHNMFDVRVYNHYMRTGGPEPPSIMETLARRLHDHAITDAVEELLFEHKVVAVMGGHSIKRTDPEFTQVATLSKKLTERGYLMTSGGGPGAMEATHLGAWFTNRSQDELLEGVSILSDAPHYKPKYEWIETALCVKARFPLVPNTDSTLPVSMGVPTWLYGHEPPTIFATHIAKYFANSVREDGLLAVAKHGVVFSPGNIGTIQEIFQDAAQNRYKTAGVMSPMVFFGKDYWTREKPIYPVLKQISADREYGSLISIADTVDEVIEILEDFELPK